MHPILFSIGPISLHTYGLMVALAFLTGMQVMRFLAPRKRVSETFVLDLSGVALISGLIGARLLYVLLNLDYFSAKPQDILKIWEGGLVFYGGFIAAAAASVYYTRSRRYFVANVADVSAPALAIGQAIGRLGCFFAGCCYGKPTDFFCAVQFKDPAALAPLGINLHPTQLYESAGAMVLGGVLFWRLLNRKDPPGFVFWFYVLGYGILRFILEGFRGDIRGGVMAGMYPSQWIALIAVVLASSVLIAQVSEKSSK